MYSRAASNMERSLLAQARYLSTSLNCAEYAFRNFQYTYPLRIIHSLFKIIMDLVFDTFQKWFQKKSLKFLHRYQVPWFYDVHHQAVNLFILCTSMAFHLKFYGRIKGKTLAINLKKVEEKNVIRFFRKTPFYRVFNENCKTYTNTYVNRSQKRF